MFICRDITERYLISVYWEKKTLFVVVKEVFDTGDLKQCSAVRYSQSEARELIRDLSNEVHNLHAVEVDGMTAMAIVGRIAEGIRTPSANVVPSRITPEMWN